MKTKKKKTAKKQNCVQPVRKRLAQSCPIVANYEPCMSLEVSEEGKAVELHLDTAIGTYSEWIEGEGGDIALIRSQHTRRVVGVRLPLYRNNLAVFHDGPIRINTGFRKNPLPELPELITFDPAKSHSTTVQRDAGQDPERGRRRE